MPDFNYPERQIYGKGNCTEKISGKIQPDSFYPDTGKWNITFCIETNSEVTARS